MGRACRICGGPPYCRSTPFRLDQSNRALTRTASDLTELTGWPLLTTHTQLALQAKRHGLPRDWHDLSRF